MKKLKTTIIAAFILIIGLLIYNQDKKATKQAVFDAAWEEQGRIHNNFNNN